MITHKKLFASFLVLYTGFVLAQAQQSINAAGGNALGTGGSVSYSVGQVVYSSQTSAAGSVVQGVQQAYTIEVVEGINESSIDLKCSAYPNPTTDILVLTVETQFIASPSNGASSLTQETQCIASLHDINGKLLQTINIVSAQTTISMGHLSAGIYLLKIFVPSTNKETKVFKIIKN